MARILFFVFLAFLVWLVVRIAGAQRPRVARRDEPSGATSRPAAEHQPASEHQPVTQCAWCGVHVPVDAALALPDGRIYCSGAHRDEARLAMAKSESAS